MQFTRADAEGRQYISSYGSGKFRISTKEWFCPVLVTPEATIEWTCCDVADLTLDDLAPLFDHEPPIEILVIGCGERNKFISPALKQAARDKGLAIEHMDTGAAARTYTLLNTDARRVAAALIPV